MAHIACRLELMSNKLPWSTINTIYVLLLLAEEQEKKKHKLADGKILISFMQMVCFSFVTFTA